MHNVKLCGSLESAIYYIVPLHVFRRNVSGYFPIMYTIENANCHRSWVSTFVQSDVKFYQVTKSLVLLFLPDFPR